MDKWVFYCPPMVNLGLCYMMEQIVPVDNTRVSVSTAFFSFGETLLVATRSYTEMRLVRLF